MTTDIYQWKMSARPHKDSIIALKKEIADAHSSQAQFPISLIVDLLPLQTNQSEEMISRGNFTITQDDFLNEADDELWMEFYDPVIEDFFATIPAFWKGTLKNENNIITILFDEPLELELPKVTQLGVDRSAYQLLKSIQVSTVASISKFIDSNDEDKETWILAEFGDSEEVDLATFDLHAVGKDTESFGARMVNPLVAFADGENESNCGSDPNEPVWYVYKRGQLCIVHHGTMYGSNGYTVVYGPDTKAACDNWVNNNCDDASLC
jgi:hypothetical protein